MPIYLRVSVETRIAMHNLKTIKSITLDDGKTTESGKDLLRGFLNKELPNSLCKQNDVNTLLSKANEKDSAIYQFAQLLENEYNRKLFKKAIEKQAKSPGTKAKGLFYTLIWQKGNLNIENLNKSKIKAFLLATNDIDNDINDTDVKTEDAKSKRMKNKNIIEKLKSGRLSNILKAFMALVLWDYIVLKEKAKKLITSSESSKSESGSESESEPESESESESKSEPESESKSESKSESESESESKSESESESKSESESESKSESESESKSESEPESEPESEINLKTNLEIIRNNILLWTVKEAVERPPLAVDDETFAKIIKKHKGDICYRAIVGIGEEEFKERYRNLIIHLGAKSSTTKLENGERVHGEGVYFATYFPDSAQRFGLGTIPCRSDQAPTIYMQNIDKTYCVIYMAYKLDASPVSTIIDENGMNTGYYVMRENVSFVLRKNILDLSPTNVLENAVKELGIKSFPHYIGTERFGAIKIAHHLRSLPSDWWTAVGLERPKIY